MLRHTARPTEAVARFLDLLALSVALPLSFGLYRRTAPLARAGLAEFDRYWLPLLVTVLAWGAAAWAYRVYDSRPHSLRDEFMRIARAMVLVAFAVFAVIFFAQLQWVSRLLTGLYFVTALALICANRVVLRWLASAAGASPGSPRYYAVVGSGDLAAEIIAKLHLHPEWAMRLAGFVLEEGARPADPNCVVLGRVAQLGKILEEHVLDDVVFAVPRERLHAIEDAVKVCEEQGVGVMIALDVLRFGNARMSVGDLNGLPMLALTRTPSDELALAAKRLFDVVTSSIVLLLLSPVLLAVAAAIKLDSPGPIFFRQKRVGLQGRVFGIFKFRSMYVNAEARLDSLRAHNEMSGPVFKMRNDPRITRVGRFIRRTSLDEFPQFWNVLRGEMSVVGPRPPLPSEVRQYKRWQRRRLSVKPGITCLWQISGRNNVDFDRWMELDLEYIDQWSLWNDIQICLKTIPAVLGTRGAR
ncbi:MAG TPA: sugar transferase [Anaeromyxobacter sp.]|nr:sugar transferase [Anaeromyxobacter sp.]